MLLETIKTVINIRNLPILRGILIPSEGDLHYIGGNEVLPPPLETDEESECIRKLIDEEDMEARSTLIEHN